MYASVFTKMLAALSLVSLANAVIITPDANMGSLSTGSVKGNLTNPTSRESLLTPASATQSIDYVEDDAASFTTRRDIHFMDSIRNLISTPTKVCVFAYHAFVDGSKSDMRGES